MKDRVRWGVLGCARIATNRMIPAMLETDVAELWAIASRTLERAKSAAERFGASRAYGSYEELLADPATDVVYVPLPNHLHKPWSIAALRAGKHVLCEKPIALDAAEAREMQAVAQETGRFLIEAFMYRFSPVVQKALEIIRSGRLGDLKAMHSAFTFLMGDDPSNIRLQADAGGGALYDVGCYCINILRTVAGREPLSACASLSWSEKHHVDVGGAGVLSFGEELYGTFNTGFNAGYGCFFRAIGTKGTIELPDGFLGRGREAGLLLTVDDQKERTAVPLIDAYKLQIEDMCEAIRGAHAPRYAWEPLDANMSVIDACYSSDKSGCAVEV